MQKNKWKVIKKGIVVKICNSIEEAEKHYKKYDCDCIKRVKEDDDLNDIFEYRKGG